MLCMFADALSILVPGPVRWVNDCTRWDSMCFQLIAIRLPIEGGKHFSCKI